MMAINNGSALRAGAFTDSAGTDWKYCTARGCRAKLGKDIKNRNLVKAIPTAAGCPGCDCVLFSRRRGGAAWVFENSTGGWVTKKGGTSYSARCVEKA